MKRDPPANKLSCSQPTAGRSPPRRAGRPRRPPQLAEIQALDAELADTVALEDYRRAAELKAKLAELEGMDTVGEVLKVGGAGGAGAGRSLQVGAGLGASLLAGRTHSVCRLGRLAHAGRLASPAERSTA